MIMHDSIPSRIVDTIFNNPLQITEDPIIVQCFQLYGSGREHVNNIHIFLQHWRYRHYSIEAIHLNRLINNMPLQVLGNKSIHTCNLVALY